MVETIKFIFMGGAIMMRWEKITIEYSELETIRKHNAECLLKRFAFGNFNWSWYNKAIRKFPNAIPKDFTPDGIIHPTIF